MTAAMRKSLLNMLSTWISRAYSGSIVPTCSFASLIGSLYLRALHEELTQAVNSAGWKGSVTPSRRIVSELLWWSRNIIWNTLLDFAYKPSQATLTTDAALAGWGASLTLGNQSLTISAFFPPQEDLTSSN
jgi:hypothetical protein